MIWKTVVVQLLSYVQLFATTWTAADQASLSFIISWCLFKLMFIELILRSTSSCSVSPFYCLQSFPASGSFSRSWIFASGCQSIRASALVSVLPMNVQDWFPLGWTGWISSQSQGTLKSLLQHHSLKASILWCSTFFIVHLSPPYMTTGKNHSFECMDLCHQSDVSGF